MTTPNAIFAGEKGIVAMCTAVLFRIGHRFRGRASEWFCAANMAAWGATLLHESQTFTSPAFAAFQWIGEDRTGMAVGGIGCLWLVGLIVNGSMERTTSLIRSICAALGSLTYGFLAIGFYISYLLTGVLSTGISNYALISALGAYALFWIRRDRKSGDHEKARVG